MINTDDVLHALESQIYQAVVASHGDKTARACARAMVECLFLNFRKGYLYIPTTDMASLQEHYARIWNDFSGRNHNELAIKYHLSVQRIYAITKEMRKAYVKTRQHDLFPTPEAASTKPLTLVVMEDYLPHELTRVGLPLDAAKRISTDLAVFLCQTYPGISIRITEAHWQKRNGGGSEDLFDWGEPEPV